VNHIEEGLREREKREREREREKETGVREEKREICIYMTQPV